MPLFHSPAPFVFESGETLPSLAIAYDTYGTLKPDGSNVVWAVHALTANSDVCDWWSGLFGQGALFDPAEHFIVCANNLGSCYGTTGPASSGLYGDFPSFTVRDMVKAHQLLADRLGITHIETLIGGSMGGQQCLEWAAEEPARFGNLILVATNARHSAWGIAFNESQRMAIAADATWGEPRADAAQAGLAAARSIALLSYRGYEAYTSTQQEPSDTPGAEGFRAATYQRYQGRKLVDRFDAYAYWRLSEAMDSHNIGRGRGGVEKALAQILAPTTIIGIENDLLFPFSEQQFIAAHLPNAHLTAIHSPYGHDGFLIEGWAIAGAILNGRVERV